MNTTFTASRDTAQPARPISSPIAVASIAVYGIAVLVLASVFGALDRQILILLAEPMRASLQLSDTRLGLLQGAGITLFAGLASVPLGWLADRHGRRGVLAACVLIWAAGTAACGLARNYAELFAAAAALGLGEAGLAPIIYGLIPEIVSARRRALANGVYALAAIFGAGIGIALSGALVRELEHLRSTLPAAMQALESWRLAFLAVAVPGPLVALAVLLIRRHPSSSDAHDPSAVPAQALGPYARTHRRTMVGVFGGSGLATLGVAASSNWLPIIATRQFHVPASAVGVGIGSAYLLGTTAGALLAAAGMKLLRARLGLALPVRVLVLGSAVAAVAALAMLRADSAAALYTLFGIQVAALIAGSVLLPTLLQDMSPAALRSRVIAIGALIAVVLGSLSPVLVGTLSDLLTGKPSGLLNAVAWIGAIAFAAAALLMLSAESAFVRSVALVHPDLIPSSPTKPHQEISHE